MAYSRRVMKSEHSTAPAAVEVAGVTFQYAGPTDMAFRLDLPDLSLPPGRTLACIGPSGSGKSTFLSLLAGILLPASGTIRLWGENHAAWSDAKRRNYRISKIGLVFQEFELLDHLSVRENILLPYFVNKSLQHNDDAADYLVEVARLTGLERHLRKKPKQLSQGERQRVALCRALVTRPALLLADEPTGNLDPHNTQNVLDIMLAEVRRRQTTLVMVTHDHSLVSAFDEVLDFERQAITAAVDPSSAPNEN